MITAVDPKDLFCLENVQGSIAYPKKALAIASYDITSVTAVKEDAWSFDALETVIHHITFIGTTVNVGINTVVIYNVKTGKPLIFPDQVPDFPTFNLDPSPDNPPDASPALFKPRTIQFGPRGIWMPHGFGVRANAPQARLHIYYTMTL